MKNVLAVLTLYVLCYSCSKPVQPGKTTTTKPRTLDSVCSGSLMGNFDLDKNGRARFITDTTGGIVIHYMESTSPADNFFASVNCDSQTIAIPVQAVSKPSFFDSVRATGRIFPDKLVISYSYWEKVEYRKWLYMGDDTLRPR